MEDLYQRLTLPTIKLSITAQLMSYMMPNSMPH